MSKKLHWFLRKSPKSVQKKSILREKRTMYGIMLNSQRLSIKCASVLNLQVAILANFNNHNAFCHYQT